MSCLEDIAPEDSRWNGQCYVFDRRVTVGHGVMPGSDTVCNACGLPVSTEETTHRGFELGVCCAYYFGIYTEEDRGRFHDRQAQAVRESKQEAE